MTTRKRIAAFVAFLFAIVLIVVISPSARAGMLNEGVHRVQRSCTGTMGNGVAFQGTISTTFQIDFVRHDPAPGERDVYNFTMKDALYTGTAYRAGAFPTIEVTAGQGDSLALFKMATNGGGISGSNAPFGDNWPVPAEQIGPITLRTLGTAPAIAPAWIPFQIASPKGANNNWMKINFGDGRMQNDCVFYIDLGMLNEPEPTEFGNANFPNCSGFIVEEGEEGTSLADANANLAYKLIKDPLSNHFLLSDLVFSLTETKNAFVFPGDPYDWYDTHHLILHSGDGLVSYLDPVGGITYPDTQTASPVELHWPDPGASPAQNAPQGASFDYTEGEPPPYIEWVANSTGGVEDQCSQRWYLGNEWDNTGLDPDLNWENQAQFAFDDCQGGFGTVEINATWQSDFNEKYDRIKTLQVNNSSTNRITIERYLVPGSTALTNRAPQIKSLTPDRIWTVSGVGDADASRIVAPLASRSWDVASPGKWNLVYGSYSAPTSVNLFNPQDFVVKMSLRAWIPNPANLTQWIPCTAADVDLRNLQLSPNAA